MSRSMRPYFNQKKFRLSFDQDFEQVMRLCGKTQRNGQQFGTWISEEMIEGYTALHKQGYAHSVEVWQREEWWAGSTALRGNAFFGESMFATVNNASKFGFITLTRRLEELDNHLFIARKQVTWLPWEAAPSPAKILAFLGKSGQSDPQGFLVQDHGMFSPTE